MVEEIDQMVVSKELAFVRSKLDRVLQLQQPTDTHDQKLARLNRQFSGRALFSFKIPQDPNYRDYANVDNKYGIKLAIFFPTTKKIKIYISPIFFRKLRDPSLATRLTGIFLHELKHQEQFTQKYDFFCKTHSEYLKEPCEIESYALEAAFFIKYNNVNRSWLNRPEKFGKLAKKVDPFSYYYEDYHKWKKKPDPVFNQFRNKTVHFLRLI